MDGWIDERMEEGWIGKLMNSARGVKGEEEKKKGKRIHNRR